MLSKNDKNINNDSDETSLKNNNYGIVLKNIFSRKAIYKNFLWIDLFYTIIYLIISAGLFCICILDLYVGITIGIVSLVLFSSGLVFLRNNDCRVYYQIFIFLKYLFSKKRINMDENGESKFISIYKDSLQYQNNKETFFISCFNIEGLPIDDNLSADKEEYIIDLFEEIIKNINQSHTLLNIKENISFAKNIEIINKKVLEENIKKNNNLYNQLLNQINQFRKWEENEEFSKKEWYLIFYANSYESLNKIRYLINEEYKRLFYINEVNTNKLKEILFSLIGEDEIKFSFNKFKIKNKTKKITTISSSTLPVTVSKKYWLNSLTSKEWTTVLTISKISQNYARKYFLKSKDREIENSNKNIVLNYKNISNSLEIGSDNLKAYNINFLVDSSKRRDLDEKIDELEERVNNCKFDLNKLNFLQKKYFDFLIPNSKIKKINFNTQLDSLTFAHSFPFISNELIENNGIYLGKDINNNQPIVLDVWNKKHRNSSNIVTIGDQEGGKIEFNKKILINQILMGNKIYILDPKGDYKELVEYYNGKTLTINDENFIINPLQIFIQSSTNKNTNFLITEHLKFLKDWFNNLFLQEKNKYQEFEEIIIFILREIDELYKEFNLYSKNIIELKNDEFPTIGNLIKKIGNKDNLIISELLKKYFSSDSGNRNLFNGYTTNFINNSEITLFNINDFLFIDSNNLKNAEISLFLLYIQNDILKYNIRYSNNLHSVLLISNVNNYLESQNNEILKVIKNIANNFNINNNQLIIDLNSSINLYDGSKNIINEVKNLLSKENIQYIFIFNSSEPSIKEIANLFESLFYPLSQKEQEMLTIPKSGNCIFINGYIQKLILKINILYNEFLAMNNKNDK